MALSSADDLSDDEVFIGKLTITEVKKHIFSGRPSCASTDFQRVLNSSVNTCSIEKEDHTSFKIIEINSLPNLNSPYLKHSTSDASFLEMEEYVNKLCLSPEKINSKDDLTYKKEQVNINSEDIIKFEAKQMAQSPNVEIIKNVHSNVLQEQNIKVQETDAKVGKETASVTPLKRDNQFIDTDVFKTPLTSIKSKPTFKTSSNTPHCSKNTYKTPMKKSNIPKYQDIMSPVAAYIHQSPQTPLVQNIHHKKTLTGLSLIPQLGKNYIKPANKENIKLPLIAYKSAKVTKLIDLPEDKKIPKSCTKTSSSIPRPTIIKHTHREIGPKKKATNIEDSFANLSYHQAEISVCTQKLAYKTKK